MPLKRDAFWERFSFHSPLSSSILLLSRVPLHSLIILVWLSLVNEKTNIERSHLCYFYSESKAGVLEGWLIELVRDTTVLALPQNHWIATSGCGDQQSVLKKLFG